LAGCNQAEFCRGCRDSGSYRAEFIELFFLFSQLGLCSFAGGLLAWMQRAFVEQRGWLGKFPHQHHDHFSLHRRVNLEIYDPSAPNKLYKLDKNSFWRDVIAIPPSILNEKGRWPIKDMSRFVVAFVDFRDLCHSAEI